MTEGEPDRRVQAISVYQSAVKPPRSLLDATEEELAVLDARLREHFHTIARCQHLFQGYLEGRATLQDWEEARRAADRARVAYERKCDAILMRTFRI